MGGGRGRRAECLFAFDCPKEAANLTNYYVQNCTNFDLELHKSIFNCSFCVELHTKKALHLITALLIRISSYSFSILVHVNYNVLSRAKMLFIILVGCRVRMGQNGSG